MGLDTTHDCWHGAYSAFMRWRCQVARFAGLPPLEMMEGFYQRGNLFWFRHQLTELHNNALDRLEDSLPIHWDILKPNPLHKLLYHSDCDGEIAAEDCGLIADALEELLPQFEALGDGVGHIGNWKAKTEQFIAGLRNAAAAGENVEFH